MVPLKFSLRILTYLQLAVGNNFLHTSYFTAVSDAMQSLNISTAVGIAVASTAVVVFIAGFLAGVLVYHYISKHQSQGSKSLPSHQQQQTISSSNPLQQTGPEYAEVIKLRQNRAYEDTQTGIEMRANEAYQPMQH